MTSCKATYVTNTLKTKKGMLMDNLSFSYCRKNIISKIKTYALKYFNLLNGLAYS